MGLHIGGAAMLTISCAGSGSQGKAMTAFSPTPTYRHRTPCHETLPHEKNARQVKAPGCFIRRRRSRRVISTRTMAWRRKNMHLPGVGRKIGLGCVARGRGQGL